MDRELLLEIGCEELPASWLPSLTSQIGDVLIAGLRAHRLTPESPAETFSTPRRLAARVGRVSERQTDLEELVTGPPVLAAFKPDGTPTPAAEGFATKNGTNVQSLERVETPKGSYLAFTRRQRGRAAVDVLPDVLRDTLRGLTFPKLMHWDAKLEDGRGELLFGRPIRWLLYTYGGRVVPFTISRTDAAQSSSVQDVMSGAVTYGHRFLTTSGRAGRAVKVRSFDEYKSKLLENFVILEREERHNKIARELDAKAQRLQGRVSRAARTASTLLHEVPDLVEYPAVVAGTFGPEFLELPQEVLTTTLVHHQHYFPIEGDEGRLKNAFLAVTNIDPKDERVIARNAERVVTARLRDARFFWEADRTVTLESRLDRLGTLLFHKRLGSYKEKAARIETLARQIARALGADDQAAADAGLAARLAKADLTTDMVREFTELQGTMGGIYAREEGMPEQVWKAMYFHYLPIAVEADAGPPLTQLGSACLTWAAVSLADKLDTITGLFAAGEKPTGSRDPYGLRRAAQGVVKILADLPVFGVRHAERVDLDALVDMAVAQHADVPIGAVRAFIWERAEYLFERRGARADEIRVVATLDAARRHLPLALQRIRAVSAMRTSASFRALAALFKRVKNITKTVNDEGDDLSAIRGVLTEPAELTLLDEFGTKWPLIEAALGRGRADEAMGELAALYPAVDRFFTDVLVMADDPMLRRARLALLTRLRTVVLTHIGDISEVVAEESAT
ncbi:MAG: glycine--tRNA ligase subunit beta [Acidobacteriaceae bacterium]|nr:glycine--tRNA ligase subunit beta [Acidobacteriaceae bacterium]